MGELDFDFSKTGYCGILSDSFAVIWCDNDPLFRRLLRFRDSLRESFLKANGEISHIFRYDGIYYKAVITRLVNNDIMCRIYPATEKARLASSGIFNSSADICHNALNILNLSDLLRKDDNDNFNDKVNLLSSYASEIYDHGLDIMRYCGTGKGETYISLRKYVFDTFYRLERYTKADNRKVCPVIDISAFQVKIDYNLFEIAVLNMIKLYYLVGDDDFVIVISDNDKGIEKTISVRCEFGAGKSFSEKAFKSLGRTLKSLFISLNGIVKLKKDGERIEIAGAVPIMQLKPGKNSDEAEMLFLNREVWEQDNDKPLKLYHHINGNSFRMNIENLEDIDYEDNISSILGFLIDNK